jgi:hypothetical protein
MLRMQWPRPAGACVACTVSSARYLPQATGVLRRLTNASSKKMENHAHAMALHFMYYNFVQVHQTLKVTPAMAADVTKRLWEIGDMVDVLEAWEHSAR